MIESRTSRMNESMLDVLSLKHKVTANNIANADTPHYKSQAVVFEEELRRQQGKELALKRTRTKHLPLPSEGGGVIPHKVVEMENSVMNNNQNNVDIDREMTNLASNQLAYNVIVQRVGGHYAKYKKLFTDLK